MTLLQLQHHMTSLTVTVRMEMRKSVGVITLVRAPNESSDSYYGAAYLLDENGNLLTAVHGQRDWGGFGCSVTCFATTILVEAPLTAWDGNFQAGAAYVYDISGNLVT